MALGNNLKRIKKDSLIPGKKEKPVKGKPNVVAKEKPSLKAKNKSVQKTKIAASKVRSSATLKKTKKVDTSSSQSISNVQQLKTKQAKASKGTHKQPTKKIKETKSLAANKPKEIATQDEKILLGGKEGATITAKLIPSRRKTVRKTKLIFEGSLSLIDAEDIKGCLLTTFNNYDVIDIQLLNITHLDIIPIQMIKIFIDFYPNKKVKIDSDLPFDMKIIVDRAGFGSLMFKEEAA